MDFGYTINFRNNDNTHLPPGFRFHPTDEELITYYLLKKVLDSNFFSRAIAEVDLNKCEPWQLPEKAKMGEKEWYFFSLRDRKYPTGLRTNRATEAGYWKATGKDREIYSSKTCALVGMKKTLVFYRGRAPKGEKSNWVMHEFRLEGKFAYHYLSRSSKDEWVISRVFKKNGSSNVGSGSKKTRMNSGSAIPEPSSPSVSLPPLLDNSPYHYQTTTIARTDRDSCSYDSQTPREHVSCFSTEAFTPHQTHPLESNSRFPRNIEVSANCQENLELPYIFSSSLTAHQQFPSGSNLGWVEFAGCNTTGNWTPPVAEEPISNNAPIELDCMWTY